MSPSSAKAIRPIPATPPLRPSQAQQTVVFDASHGQPNWSQTGFSSRVMDSNFLGITEALRGPTCSCISTGEQPLAELLPKARLLVIPPPTGVYNPRKECWLAQSSSLFTARDIEAILAFVHAGGRLLAFSYRFGDSFTQTNLRDLFSPLGCLLNHDAVLDLTRLRTTHPLQAFF